MSETICVQERLPAGAAAVLINRNHTYRDLFMPIDATEKRLFDAIDGNRTIGDILKQHCRPRRDNSNRKHAPSLNGSGGMIRWCSTLTMMASGLGHPTIEDPFTDLSLQRLLAMLYTRLAPIQALILFGQSPEPWLILE